MSKMQIKSMHRWERRIRSYASVVRLYLSSKNFATSYLKLELYTYLTVDMTAGQKNRAL